MPSRISAEMAHEPTAVYRLYAADGTLLYVGCSGNPEQRFASHAARKSWWPQVASKSITWCHDRGAAFREEARAIDDERPVHNVSRPLQPVATWPVGAMDSSRDDRPEDRHVSQIGISVRLPLDDFTRLETARKALGITRRQAVIAAIRDWLDKYDPETTPEEHWPMASITIAFCDEDHPVPGIDCALAAGLFVMHATAVRMWIDEERRKVGPAGHFVVADDEWVNPGGGTRSLTIPADWRDLDALATIRSRAETTEEQ